MASSPRAARRRVGCALAGMALLTCCAATALDRLELDVRGVQGPNWGSGALRVRVGLSASGGLTLEASATQVRLPAPLSTLTRVRLACSDGQLEQTQVHCARAQLHLERDGVAPITLRARAALALAPVELTVTLARQPFAGGHLSGQIQLADTTTRIALRLQQLDATQLAARVTALLAAPNFEITQGHIDAEFAHSRSATRGKQRLRIELSELAFSDASGLRAGEALNAKAALDARRVGDTWRGDAELEVDAGALYVDPLLLEFAEQPLRLVLSDFSFETAGALRTAFMLRHRPLSPIEGRIAARLAAPRALTALSLTLPSTPALALYQRYVQAFAPSALAELDLSGDLALALDWQSGGPSRLDLTLRDVAVGDRAGRFALTGVDGALGWRDALAPVRSELGVEAMQIGRLALGSARFAGILHEHHLQLEPLRIPILDGALKVARLEAHGLGGDALRIAIDSALEPVSLSALSEQLAWLPLAGTLSGRLPALRYADDVLSVGGDVELELFDGQVRISELSIAHPLSAVPETRAQLTLDNLSLEQLSHSLAFGRIEGRLDGEVRDLVMQGWRPVAFDGFLGTPADDRSRHRISQRAVDSLASLGGANAVISSTFLRFFESFSYQRLGLGCRLRAGVCEMRGAGPAKQGYYIVKGGGLPPRVDVVGYNRRVDFETLLKRLRALGSAGEAIIR